MGDFWRQWKEWDPPYPEDEYGPEWWGGFLRVVAHMVVLVGAVSTLLWWAQ